jgi:endoglucanase
VTRAGPGFAGAVAVAVAGLAGCGSHRGAADGSPPGHVPTGCAAAPPDSVAAGGYYVNGNSVCTAGGRVHQFHGVDRPSLEWSAAGEGLLASDFRKMASWNPNVVRIGLNQDFWIAASPLYDPNYVPLVDNAVTWAESAGMDVILDLHWSDAGVLGGCPTSSRCQQKMPDANSLTFWSQVAARYKDDGRVLFELYNEPHGVAWNVWRAGGDTGDGWQAVGMQSLYDVVRATGAHNLVIIGGLDWSYDLSGVPANRVDGYNIVYASHPYNNATARGARFWDLYWGFLTETDPVIVTEFGDTSTACPTAYSADVIAYADGHGAGWTAWGWFPGGCTFPALVEDWVGTPSALGTVVKTALLGYDDPPNSSPPPAVMDGPHVSYAFDRSTEGWRVDDHPDPVLTNLGASMPADGSAPNLTFSGSDGDPARGALKLTAAFTDFDQYVDIVVSVAPPGFDLSGKTLRARVRLISGSLVACTVQFIARAGSLDSVPASGPSLNGTDLLQGTWVPLIFDLGGVTTAGFDPAKLVQIGVRVSSGGSSASVPFAATGDAILEIDTVTE